MKKERGITLIALVITILILLILAGITLNLALDENGIIRKSQEVVNKYEEAQKDELENLNQLASVLDGRNDENETELKPKLVTNISIKESTTIERGKTEKLDVTIEDNYFKGDGYLVKCALTPERSICVDSPVYIEPGTQIKLALKKYQ